MAWPGKGGGGGRGGWCCGYAAVAVVCVVVRNCQYAYVQRPHHPPTPTLNPSPMPDGRLTPTPATTTRCHLAHLGLE